MGVKQNLAFLAKYYSISLGSAMEYKANFLVQSVGMFVNNIFWIFFWWLFFQRFGSVNGWVFQDVALLWAVTTFSFGLGAGFLRQSAKIAKLIENGMLDYYLTLPKNVLMHVILKFHYPPMGDLFFGLMLAFLYLPEGAWPLFLLTSVLGAIILTSVSILVNCAGFWLGRFDSAATTARDTFFIMSSYPMSVFGGFTKFFIIFIFPAGMAGGVPVELMRNFSWTWLSYMVLVTLAFCMLAIGVFYAGLKRYESGNTMMLRG
jgi:ABC-2 type transport system permease protein